MTEAQIRAQVEAIRSKDATARAVALQAEHPWGGPERLTIGGEVHRVVFCRSDLHLRDALLEGERAGEHVVALCPFGDDDLGDDVRVRLAKARVFRPMAGEVLASLFKVKSKGLDRRILACQPLVDALIDHAPMEGYPARPSGSLDLQTAWTEVVGRALGNRATVATIEGFLEASLQPSLGRFLESLQAGLRDAFFAWAGLSLGSPFRWIQHLVAAGRTMDLVPVGLVMNLVSSNIGAGARDLASAQARMESWFDRARPDAATARAWGQAATNVIHGLASRDGRSALLKITMARFDELLDEIKLSELAAGSDYSPHGLTLRFRQFAKVVADSLPPKGAASHPGQRLGDALNRIGNHILGADHETQRGRCQMAARLTCWLATQPTTSKPGTLADLVMYYQKEGAFVDRARTAIECNEADPDLKRAFASTAKAVNEAWLGLESSFAMRLAEWIQGGSPEIPGVMPIENALTGVIGPVAAKFPILLLVMDGMSAPVFRELLDDLVSRGRWLEASPGKPALPSALLAAVPSITEISRRALFRGDLTPSTTPTEQSAFRTNDLLHSQSAGQSRPELFLKGDLQDDGEPGISEAVRKAIENRKCRVVGVVLNVIDDHLKGSDQFAYEWNLDSIQPLREILQAAANAGRAVIITSDHGHVLERESKVEVEVADGGDRHRFGGGKVRDGEVRITGPRVQQALGRDAVIVPWSRRSRYGPKRQGYHGGVNPQEMVVPFVLLHHAQTPLPPGWKDVVPSPAHPSWWQLRAFETSEAGIDLAVTAALPPEVKGMELFVHAEVDRSRSSIALAYRLLDSEIYKEQCRRGVRGAPKPSDVALFIESLDARGGGMPFEALAQRLGLPLIRLGGHVQNLARILNVDGYEVVNLDVSTGTVTLNVALLKQQFQLDN